MAETSTLMTIGEFSARSRLSVRMLRHYDTHGVITPAHVDPWTGHRRYAPDQLRDAADVRNLRDVGFGVSAIAALLAARGDSAWEAALHLQRDALAEDLRAAQARLDLLDRLLHPGDPMSITISRVTMPAMTVVALRGTVPTYADEGLLWQQMMPVVDAQGIRPVGPCGVIEFDDEYTEHDVDLAVFLPVTPGTIAREPLQILDLPERSCLVACVIGPYSLIAAAHDQLNERLTNEGLTLLRDGSPAAKGFNRYLTTPDQVAPEDLVTEVCLPLA